MQTFPLFNDLVDRSEEGFRPHLTVGQFKGKQQVEQMQRKFQETWQPIKFLVNCVFLISRSDNDPFEVRKVIPLRGVTYQEAVKASGFSNSQPVTQRPKADQFTVFLGNIPPGTTVDELKVLCSSVPDLQLVSIVIPVDKRTKIQRSFAFLEVHGLNQATAVSALTGSTLRGATISAKLAK